MNRDPSNYDITRDPIYLLQRKIGRNNWFTESVWLTRKEAEDFAKRHEYRWPRGWQVYCTCAEGELAKALNELPEIVKRQTMERK